MCAIKNKNPVSAPFLRSAHKFIMELKDGGFLDMRLIRKEDDKLDITVYRTQTHTDRHLHFVSSDVEVMLHMLTAFVSSMVFCIFWIISSSIT